MENPFGEFNSENKRRQYFTEKWGRVDPVEYVLGTRFDTLCNLTTGAYDQVVVTDKFVYIPILKMLEFIYKHPNIKEMMQTDSSSRENLNDLCNGDLFKSHALFSKPRHAIQIQLFYDDFETANPLGSKRKKTLKRMAFLKYLIHLRRILKYWRGMELGSPCMITHCMELLSK